MMMIFPLLTQVSTFTSFLMKRTVPNRASSGIKVRIERDDVNFYFKWAAITDTYKYSCIELKVKVLVAQLYLTLCDPVDCSPPAPLSMEFSRLEWVAIPFPGDIPDPGIEPGLLYSRRTLYHLSHQGSLYSIGQMKSFLSRLLNLHRLHF